MAKPSVVPTWAVTLANDGTTGQPNRAEPSAGKKTTGFTFNEQPPRQDVNWLFWILSQWAAWVDDNMDQAVKTTSSVQFANVDSHSLTRQGTGNLTIYAADGEIKVGDSGAPGYTDFIDASGAVGVTIDPDNNTVFADSFDGTLNGPAVISGSLSVFGSATDITGAELQTLSSGGNADSLHKHSLPNAVPRARGYNATFSSHTINEASGWTELTFSALDFLQFTSGTNSFVAGVTGIYRVNYGFFAHITAATCPTGAWVEMAVGVNGAATTSTKVMYIVPGATSFVSDTPASHSLLVDLSAGQTVTFRIRAIAYSGTLATNVVVAAHQMYCNITLLDATTL